MEIYRWLPTLYRGFDFHLGYDIQGGPLPQMVMTVGDREYLFSQDDVSASVTIPKKDIDTIHDDEPSHLICRGGGQDMLVATGYVRVIGDYVNG